MAETLKVWIDQDLCTGDGICSEITPDLFGGHSDGLWYVKDASWPSIYGPDVATQDGEPMVRHGNNRTTERDYVTFTPALMEAALESAEECPGECIFIEVIE